MVEAVSVVITLLLLAVLILQVFVLKKSGAPDLSALLPRLDGLDRGVERTERSTREEMAKNREEATAQAHNLRREVGLSVKDLTDAMLKTLAELSAAQRGQQESLAQQLSALLESNHASAKAMREEIINALKAFSDSTVKSVGEVGALQKAQLEAFAQQLVTLTEANEKRLEGLRLTLEQKLKELQTENAGKLEEMRKTVDEKLHGTLEKRLGESFKQVSERLEQVYKGLGEMQTLASGVGDLKKVLVNVKTRGTWGEVQLGLLIEQVLAPEQYASNVATKNTGERVEFAVKLPGRSDNPEEVVWLPIDAKFPIEDYQRLVEAQEHADPEAADAAAKQLESRVKACARDIRDKYVSPPGTTDFGILFLPVEGLFAEVIRRPGLVDTVQRDCRVVIAGPTTLWSILNSLQLGFRTLAIQQRSSEVWALLAAVKTEWGKYGDVLDRVQKKLGEASNTIDEASKRSRAIGRKLKGVEELPTSKAHSVLALPTSPEGEGDDETG
jgi:DNA recombination protein RmuC